MPRSYIGIGSNLNDPVAQVRQAFLALSNIRDTKLLAQSALYSNPPMGPKDQPNYVNAVAELDTALSPQALLVQLLEVELRAGRDRTKAIHWGPRVLDLDLLVYSDRIVSEANLKVPHPGIAHRSFVLLPLFDIAPQLDIPGVGALAELLARVSPDELCRIE